MDDQIRELVSIVKAITEGFEKVAQEINDATRATKEQTNALLELSEVTREGFEKLIKEIQKMRQNIIS